MNDSAQITELELLRELRHMRQEYAELQQEVATLRQIITDITLIVLAPGWNNK